MAGENWYCVLWNEKGAMHVLPWREVLERNRHAMMTGKPHGDYIVGLRDSLPKALDLEREMKRRKRNDAGGEA